MRFSIAANDTSKARAKLMDATSNGGAAFYKALSAAGVPYKPSVAVGGNKLLAGDVPPSINIKQVGTGVYDAASLGATAPKKAASSSGSSGLSQGAMIGIIVGSAVAGALLLGLLAWCCCCRNRKRMLPAERLRQQQAAEKGMNVDDQKYGDKLREQL
jgi:cell wall integrity and stress response component